LHGFRDNYAATTLENASTLDWESTEKILLFIVRGLGSFCLLTTLCFLAALCGCGGSAKDLVEVSGNVLLDGKPLTIGSVLTMPERGPGASGTINEQGEFTLTTRGMGSGASIGKHHVGVVALEGETEFNPEAPRKSLIPQKYASPETSGLTIEVKPGEPNKFTFELTSAGE
jgi:hypothetical protein